MLEYTDANRQQLIVRQSSLDRAVQILIAKGLITENDVTVSVIVHTMIIPLVNALEAVVRTPPVKQ
jgi:hypothetical protein